MNQIPNPVRPYPARPPVGCCQCASCRRHRMIVVVSAVEMAAAAASAWANYAAALANQSGGPAAIADRSRMAAMQLPVQIALAVQRVQRRYKTAAQRWAEMHAFHSGGLLVASGGAEHIVRVRDDYAVGPAGAAELREQLASMHEKSSAAVDGPVVVVDRTAHVVLSGERVIRRQGRSRFGEPEEKS